MIRPFHPFLTKASVSDSFKMEAFCIACENSNSLYKDEMYLKSSLMVKPFSFYSSSINSPHSKRFSNPNLSSHCEPSSRISFSKFSLPLHSQPQQNSSHPSTSESYLNISREELVMNGESDETVFSSIQAVEAALTIQNDIEIFEENEQKLSMTNGNGVSVRQVNKSLKVAVDVDEVLCSFLSTLNIFCAEKYNILHELEEFFVYDFSKVWKCSQSEANARVHAFFESHHFNDGIPPIPGALETLQKISNVCELSIVTSRQHIIQEPTLEWVEKHYPSIFKTVHFGNHFALEGVARPKSEICKEVGAHILIDDNPKYALECAEHGIQVLLFDWRLSYPWSKTRSGPNHPLITRVKDWYEVESIIMKHSLLSDTGAAELES